MTNHITIGNQNTRISQKSFTKQSFTSSVQVVDGLADKFVKSQENLKVTRFFQDVFTNWVPKAFFTRSLPDFAEMTFLEYTESALFYFAPELLGKFFRKLFSAFQPEKLRAKVDENILKSAKTLADEAKNDKEGTSKRALTTKAGIILACTAIPAGEYALSFAKNLFTLKVFKKSDFNNIVNLNREQNEDKEQQKRVKNSAYKHIKHAGLLSVGGLGAGFVLAKYGHRSEALQKASSLILQPGAHISSGLDKIGLGSKKLDKFLKKYITPDFDTKDGVLSLSKGQLLVSTVSGFFGYSSAGKDRGKLDQLEVWTRVPIVVFYTVFGSSLFEQAFKHLLAKKNKFPELVKKDGDSIASIPSRSQIKRIAVKLAKQNATDKHVEFNKLIKQKAFIVGVPYAFALVTMGFLLAGISRAWTQYRFNRKKKEDSLTHAALQNDYKTFAKADSSTFKGIFN